MTTPSPGLRDQSGARTALRVVGAVLLLAGLYLVLTGGAAFLRAFDDPSGLDPGFGPILRMGAGGLLCVFGLAALGAGFLGAQSRYVAGETMPVVKDSAAYLSDGEGVMNVGRTVEDRFGTARGPSCRGCGARSEEGATSCDRCGHSLH